MSEACRLRRGEGYGVCTDDVTICVKKVLRCNRFLAYIWEGGVWISKTQNNAYVRYREHYLRRITRDYRGKPLGTKGALLYMFCRHVVRSVRPKPRHSNVWAFLCHWRSGQGFPLHRFAVIPTTKTKRRK